MEKSIRILHLEDDPNDGELVAETLGADPLPCEIVRVEDDSSFATALAQGGFDLVLCDYGMPSLNGLGALRLVRQAHPELPFILVSGTIGEVRAVEALRQGATDYVLKDRLVALPGAIRRALRDARQRGEHRQAQQALLYLEKAVHSLPLGVTVVDTAGCIIYTNPAQQRMHGYTAAELLGSDASHLLGDEPTHRLTVDELRELRPWKRERTNVRKDGTSFPAQLISDVVKNASGEPIAVVTTCEDITERKGAEAQLLRHAFYDGVTGLPNRALFMDRLSRAVRRTARGSQFAVLFLDIDRFKLVNDSLGHRYGDRLLEGIARRLEACVRPGDTVSRFGGDEFAVLLEETRHGRAATRIADRIQRELSHPIVVEGQEMFSSASIGIALSRPGYGRPEEILRDADTAMYRAKALGKARYEIFDAAMHAEAASAFRMEADLRRAVERQELRLHYQPIVALETGRAIGVEALLRWEHPQRGLVLPDEFIPLAEETGLIVPIGEWVLRTACAESEAWQKPGQPPVTVAVNISARQFRQRNLASLVAQALQGRGTSGAPLELELTESAVMEPLDEVVATLHELRMTGVKVAIDDFGTGYSSLANLRRFPVDSLKIDRSFVSHIDVSADAAAIAGSVIALAHSMNLQVVAEGVETEKQLAFLRERRCHAVQGYLLGQPRPRPGARA